MVLNQIVVCSITDFEYTVACAVFDMLDIALVHGWLLDLQDDRTVRAFAWCSMWFLPQTDTLSLC